MMLQNTISARLHIGVLRERPRAAPRLQDSLAEWSKALAPGASPQGRGLEPHSCHFGFEADCCLLWLLMYMVKVQAYRCKLRALGPPFVIPSSDE